MVAIAGDDAVDLRLHRLDADDDGFLTDIQVAEAADQTHAVQLTRLLFETADQQHVAVELEKVFFGGGRARRLLRPSVTVLAIFCRAVFRNGSRFAAAPIRCHAFLLLPMRAVTKQLAFAPELGKLSALQHS